MLSTGIEPGFFSDYLPVILSGCSQRIDSLRVYELAVYESGHQSDEVAFDICGFGKPIDTAPPIVDPAGMLPWAGVVRRWPSSSEWCSTASRPATSCCPPDNAFDYQGRRIEAGTIAGFRFEIAGVVDGRTKPGGRARHPHAGRPGARLAQQPAGDAYRIVIDGSPRLDCEFSFREGDDHLAGGFNITAMRAVNAIPVLCEAEPGVVSTFDLPPVTGRGRFAS